MIKSDRMIPPAALPNLIYKMGKDMTWTRMLVKTHLLDERRQTQFGKENIESIA